jgi:hypothetical protein
VSEDFLQGLRGYKAHRLKGILRHLDVEDVESLPAHVGTLSKRIVERLDQPGQLVRSVAKLGDPARLALRVAQLAQWRAVPLAGWVLSSSKS